ncbi:putative fatty acyl-CoA reductase CG5065 [Photinus pyralis]|uniref:putative fatty acyl-CoA reductase CG5065 n=1 Tax=Photinus pyralis TaxID=7054 RepID=UPI001266F9AE|nr:putative fatty acyl-CoA reductase CG5065 [Photinus pyralis]
MLTAIQKFYANSTILVTGATGYLGTYFVEKLLRSCPDVKKVYLLVRKKRGRPNEDRLVEFFESPVYNALKRSNPRAFQTVEVLSGDLELEELGLGDGDQEKVANEVNSVFHVGATINMAETLRMSTLVNIRGTRDLLSICARAQHLKSFVYVSTAYSQLQLHEIDEIIPPSAEDADNLIAIASSRDQRQLHNATLRMLEKWPNTYTYTKHLAENVVGRSQLPTAIVRPSLIMPPYLEPESDWSSTLDWTTKLLASLNLGIIHSVHCNSKDVVDVVPVDFVVNCTLAAGWMVGTEYANSDRREEVEVFNCVSGHQNPLTWARQEELMRGYDRTMPSIKKVLHRSTFHSTNGTLNSLVDLAFLPALYLFNTKLQLVGKSTTSVQLHQAARMFMKTAAFCTGREWKFRDFNTQRLWDRLEEDDRRIFNFDIKSIDWDHFYEKLTYGLRRYTLQDDFETMGKAKLKMAALNVLHYAYFGCYLLLFLFFINVLYSKSTVRYMDVHL